MTRRWWFASLLGLLAIGDGPSPGQGPDKIRWSPVMSARDPRLEPIRRASISWDSHQGPGRAVVDLVCLVPDLPTYLEAVATWDEGHYFPILFDDVESSFRFIRAFRPARIVRMPRSAPAIKAGKLWDRAVDVVGASWSAEDRPNSDRLRGDQVPKSLGPTPQGVVLSSPAAPMLAGAVALAAGRFQPLLRLDSSKHFADALSIDEVDAFARAIDRKVGEQIPDHDALGDGCDFLTLAGDYPYRYREAKGEMDAVDDRVGRPIGEDRRWAFAGRLLGDSTESVYRAMCSLFLQPESALLFNTYEEKSIPWSVYETRTAAQKLSASLPTTQLSDTMAGIEGWHEIFDPSNRFGLVMINSMGSPNMFGIRGRQGYALDIPRGVPSAVLMIHSFSAYDPVDPSTLAARWLANGAFIFFGSMHEPFVDAFRAPSVVSELIVRRMPLVVAVRQLSGESRGMPWRLAYLGDPLYRVDPKAADRPSTRLDRWEPTAQWPSYAENARPADKADNELLLWSLKTALARLQKAGKGSKSLASDDLIETLLAIRRGKLPKPFQPVYDALLIDVLLGARKRTALKARLLELPSIERSPAVTRTIESLEGIDFFLALSHKEFSKAKAAWLLLMKASVPREFKNQCADIVAALATTSAQIDDWKATIRAASRDFPRPPESEVIEAERLRIEERWKAKP